MSLVELLLVHRERQKVK